MAIFEQICEERGITVVKDAEANAHQESMQEVVCLMQAIVNACPRGQMRGEVRGWRQDVEEALSELEIPL